jgi:hypothetical protein
LPRDADRFSTRRRQDGQYADPTHLNAINASAKLGRGAADRVFARETDPTRV